MTTYISATTLQGKTLKEDDLVVFRVKKAVGTKKLQYTVSTYFLKDRDNSDNDIIFKLLKLKKYDIAGKFYGYKTSGGSWPNANNDDYKALTRLVMELYRLCEPHTNWADRMKALR